MHFCACDIISECDYVCDSMLYVWTGIRERESQRGRKTSRKCSVMDYEGKGGGTLKRSSGGKYYSPLSDWRPTPHSLSTAKWSVYDIGGSRWKCKAHTHSHTHTHTHKHRPGEQWASTGNSFTAFLLTKASEWEQSKKECNVYGVCVIWEVCDIWEVRALV